MRLEQRLLGVFETAEQAASAVEALRRDGRSALEVFSPVPEHDLLGVAPRRFVPVRYFTFAGALVGLASGLALSIGTALYHRLVVNGMPPVSLVPYVIVGFELTVLLGGLSAFLGMLVGTRLPRLRRPRLWDPRLVEDHFGVGVSCVSGVTDQLARLLEDSGAVHVHRG